MNKRKAGKILIVAIVAVLAGAGATTIGASLTQPCDSLRLYLGAADDRVIEDVVVTFAHRPHASVRDVWRGRIARQSMVNLAINGGGPLFTNGQIHIAWRDADGTGRRESIDVDSEMVGTTVHALISGSALTDLRSNDLRPINFGPAGIATEWLSLGRALRCMVRS